MNRLIKRLQRPCPLKGCIRGKILVEAATTLEDMQIRNNSLNESVNKFIAADAENMHMKVKIEDMQGVMDAARRCDELLDCVSSSTPRPCQCPCCVLRNELAKLDQKS